MTIEAATVVAFVRTQSMLLDGFRDAFPSSRDFGFLLDFPKEGRLKLGEECWKFVRHGTGLKFIRTTPAPELVIDVHNRLGCKKAVDVWRLSQFLASLGTHQSDQQIASLLREMHESGDLRLNAEQNSYELRNGPRHLGDLLP
jgi:hypothetical protein